MTNTSNREQALNGHLPIKFLQPRSEARPHTLPSPAHGRAAGVFQLHFARVIGR